jgi:hypothetical protein
MIIVCMGNREPGRIEVLVYFSHGPVSAISEAHLSQSGRNKARRDVERLLAFQVNTGEADEGDPGVGKSLARRREREPVDGSQAPTRVPRFERPDPGISFAQGIKGLGYQGGRGFILEQEIFFLGAAAA